MYRSSSRSLTYQKYNGIPLRASIISTETEEGVPRNGTSTLSNTRLTAWFTLCKPFLIKQIKTNVFAAGTYNCDFVNSGSASPTVLKSLGTIVAAGGSAEETITISPPIVLIPGDHYFSMYRSSAARWDRYNLVSYFSGALLWMHALYADGGISSVAVFQMRLVGNYINLEGMYNFRPCNFLS